MAKTKDRKPGDACPIDGGDMIPDPKQLPEVLIARKTRNAAVPAVAARFAVHVTEKAAEHGIIHMCTSCGYRDRFQPKGATA